MHNRINKFLDDAYKVQHPFSRNQPGTDIIAKLMPGILSSSEGDLEQYVAKLEQLLSKNINCSKCEAKILVYLNIITGQRKYLKRYYEIDLKRNIRSEIYASLNSASDCLHNKLPELMSVDEMQLFLKGKLPNIQVPHNLYTVIDVPGILGGMPKPDRKTDWNALSKIGFKYVVNVESDKPLYDPAPLTFLKCVELQNDMPANPKMELIYINEIVDRAERKIMSGHGVLVHCFGGRGRSGTVIGCILKRLNYKSKDIIKYLNKLHKQRGKEGWPEFTWQAEVVEKFI